MNHTPGPLEIKPRRDEWLIEGQNEDEGKTGVPYSGHGILIANVYEDYYAKLFAAAPAMLAALTHLVERLDAGLSVGEAEEMIPARNAIAQATGKEG